MAEYSKAKTRNINQQLFPRFLYIAGGEAKGREVANRPTIRDFMEDETVGFIAELIKKNASITNLVDSNFAMLNQPLAGHYGVAGVQGLEFRPVPIKPEHKMTKAQINKELTANGFKLAREFDALPWQHMMWFQSAADTSPPSSPHPTTPSK